MKPLVVRVFLAIVMLAAAANSFGISSVKAQEGGFLTFENGVDSQVIGSEIPGVRFGTVAGFNWIYADMRTKKWNGPYPDDCSDRPSSIASPQCLYAVNGNFVASMGLLQGTGRIDFTEGNGTFFEAGFSTAVTLSIEAYNSANELISTASVAPNLRTGRLDRARVTGANISYVLIKGTANFWWMDDMATDAPGVPDEGGTPPPVQETSVAPPAFITVVNRPTPNTTVTPGSIVTYNIVVTNRGKGAAKDVIIEAPFNSSEVTLLDVTFTNTTKAWVSEVRREGLTIRTGPISGNNTSIAATMRVLVNADVANGTDLSERLSFAWRDSEKGGASTSNATLIKVGDSAANLPTYSFAVAPASGPLSATRSFETGIYAPSEPVALWISTPDGRNIPIYELDSDDQLNAEDDGSLAVNVDLSDFDPGTYSIVTYGTWTEFTATGVFVIQ